jgi:hypothetical protein
MRAPSIILVSCTLGIVAACSDVQLQADPSATDVLADNSCAIVCPAESAYAGMGGSVTCFDTHAPVCQCVDRARPMATCEPLR